MSWIGSSCEICGSIRDIDHHHLVPRRMGGSNEQAVHDEANLVTLCRDCHRNIHEGRWLLQRSQEGICVYDEHTGERIMRRLCKPGLDVPSLFQSLKLAEDSLSRLLQDLPYLSDEQLVEAFSYARTFGKRCWLAQAAILFEAQQRSTYGEHTLEAIARRFDISLRQAQKYALVWKLFFSPNGEEKNVNIDAILLDEPSWYVVAATESPEPQRWLAYAQDRKVEDQRYSVADLRRDIRLARITEGMSDMLNDIDDSPDNGTRWELWQRCPWVRLFCVRSGRPVPLGQECEGCELKRQNQE